VEATIQMIFLLGYAAYDKMYRLPDHFRKAAHCIMVCRTSVLGGHTQACPDGHFKRHWYNSCKHRMCPLCAFTQIERWLAKQKSRILNTDHFHVIFTISDELHQLWRLNTEVFTRILFKSATETLFQLLEDPEYLGAKVGIIASLHTWSKTLSLHPHLHCLVTGGGISGKDWVTASKRFLLPFKVVRKKFRGKFIAYIRKALNDGKLELPIGMRPRQMKNLLNKLGRKKWNVHLKETYSYGEGVLTYLARYLRGGPISNKRILSVKDGQVTFNCGREKVVKMTLSLERFIARYLQHVPPPNSVRVRSYGIYHHSCKEYLELSRQLLGQPPVEDIGFRDWQTLYDEQGKNHPGCCPVCGKRLVSLEMLPPANPRLPVFIYKEPDIHYDKAA
jgi:hypothetical protein